MPRQMSAGALDIHHVMKQQEESTAQAIALERGARTGFDAARLRENIVSLIIAGYRRYPESYAVDL